MGWDKNLAVFNSKEAEKVGVAVNRNVEHWREDEISWDTWSCWDIFWHFYTAPVFRVWISDGSNDTIHLQLCPWKHGSSNCLQICWRMILEMLRKKIIFTRTKTCSCWCWFTSGESLSSYVSECWELQEELRSDTHWSTARSEHNPVPAWQRFVFNQAAALNWLDNWSKGWIQAKIEKIIHNVIHDMFLHRINNRQVGEVGEVCRKLNIKIISVEIILTSGWHSAGGERVRITTTDLKLSQRYSISRRIKTGWYDPSDRAVWLIDITNSTELIVSEIYWRLDNEDLWNHVLSPPCSASHLLLILCCNTFFRGLSPVSCTSLSQATTMSEN